MSEIKKKQLFKEFLSKNTILIADKSSASRRRLVKTLVDLGAPRQTIHSIAHYSEALDIINNEKPALILSDYTLNGGSGFDLFKYYKENYPEVKNATLVLVTSNISQSSVAKAAEGDVDSFIIKPYTVNKLESSLINAVLAKLYPSKYMKKIEEGKEFLFAGDYKKALSTFNDAISLHEEPTLALFYHGQTQKMLKFSTEAESDFKKGLNINHIHFKCQVGLYEMFKSEGRVAEAYSVVKNIAKYFPANPDRLQEVIYMAIQTENYEDISDYYELYTLLEERPKVLQNYVCAGMYVLGKYLFGIDEAAKAKLIYEKNTISATGTSKFLKAMAVTLVENHCYEEAQKILPRFDNNPASESDYKIATFLANSKELDNVSLISSGLELYNQGNKHPLCVKILIRALRQEGSDKKADEYQSEAEFTWPKIFKKKRSPRAA